MLSGERIVGKSVPTVGSRHWKSGRKLNRHDPDRVITARWLSLGGYRRAAAAGSKSIRRADSTTRGAPIVAQYCRDKKIINITINVWRARDNVWWWWWTLINNNRSSITRVIAADVKETKIITIGYGFDISPTAGRYRRDNRK